MSYFPNELHKHYKIEIPLSEYENMKDKITQLEIFKNNQCYYKEVSTNYSYTKYYSISENKLLEDLSKEIKQHSLETDKYMIERNEYFNQLKKIKKSFFYKIYKLFNNI